MLLKIFLSYSNYNRNIFCYIENRSYNFCFCIFGTVNYQGQAIVDGLKECHKEPHDAHDDHNPRLNQELSVRVVLHLHHVFKAQHLVKLNLLVNFNNN